jgi:hypothetical protein
MKTIISMAGVFVASLFFLGDFSVSGEDLRLSTNRIILPRDELQADTNTIKNLFTVSSAYREAAARQMLQEANYFARQLKLAESLPITAANATINVNPPLLAGVGSVDAKEFLYSFPGHDRQPITNGFGAVWFLERGKLAYVMRKKPFARWDDGNSDDMSALFRKLAALPCLLDTNTAYQLATQWLAAVSVDVGELEKKYRPLSVQVTINEKPDSWEARPANSNQPHLKKLPIFDVTWGGAEDQDSPPIGVKIFGPTKELISLRMEDTRFSKRPPVTIPNAEKLNASMANTPTPIMKPK